MFDSDREVEGRSISPKQAALKPAWCCRKRDGRSRGVIFRNALRADADREIVDRRTGRNAPAVSSIFKLINGEIE